MSIPNSFNPLGTLGEGKLPMGYIELEYLESTGTQYIDTGVVPDNLTGLRELSSKRVETEDYVSSGARSASARFYGYCGLRSHEISYGRGNYVHTGVYLTNWNDYCDYRHNYMNSRTILANEHTLASNIITISGITSNILMFGYSVNTTTNVTKCRSRIKYLKLTQGQKLVRNFIPALDPTGRPCMFDTVTQQPFYNKGTGEFKCGYKLPSGYTAVEYLESTGTQWIDTGIYGTERHGAELKYQFPNLDGSGARIFGGRPVADGVDSVIVVGTSTGTAVSSTYLYMASHQAVIFNVASNPKFPCDTNIHTAKANLFGDMKFTLDDISGGVQPSGKQFTNTFTLNIFRFFTNGAYSEGAHGRVYHCKITEDTHLVRNFIPTLDASNRPCMYDLVTRKPFYNAGTGEFLYA